MPKIVRSFPHTLGREAATVRIKKALERERIVKADLVTVVDENWTSDYDVVFTLKIYNYAVGGEMNIEERQVRIELNLPLLAVLVKGMIESQLENEVKKLLS